MDLNTEIGNLKTSIESTRDVMSTLLGTLNDRKVASTTAIMLREEIFETVLHEYVDQLTGMVVELQELVE
jgi:hypothetical protein